MRPTPYGRGPRAAAAGADLYRLILPDFEGQPIYFPDETQALYDLIADCGIEFVVTDPPGGAPPGDRLGPRLRRPPDRVLAVAKGNLARRPPAMGYRVAESATGASVVEWTGPVGLTADDLCADAPPKPERLRVRDRATDWLRGELAAGPRRVAELDALAADVGVPERTLVRAKETVEARSHRVPDHGANRAEWYWYDPAAPWPGSAPFARPTDEREDRGRLQD